MRILDDKKFKVEAGRVYPAGSGIKVWIGYAF